jgi:hypothetical protein
MKHPLLAIGALLLALAYSLPVHAHDASDDEADETIEQLDPHCTRGIWPRDPYSENPRKLWC